jgi:hypothetical protein
MLSVQLYADKTTFQKRTDNWLKPAAAETRGRIDPGTPPDTPQPPVGNPIGDTLPYIAMLAGLYGLRIVCKRSNRVIVKQETGNFIKT